MRAAQLSLHYTGLERLLQISGILIITVARGIRKWKRRAIGSRREHAEPKVDLAPSGVRPITIVKIEQGRRSSPLSMFSYLPLGGPPESLPLPLLPEDVSGLPTSTGLPLSSGLPLSAGGPFVLVDWSD